MLRPQDSETRERRSLDGLWSFALDADGAGRPERWWAGPLPDAREMPVPASYNDVVPDTAFRDHVGDAWYQETVRVPRGWAGQRVVLRFDSATHRAVVWVDDTEVVSHEGGYMPFEADISALVQPGSEVRITVLVDNRLSWQSIPPGAVEQTPDGPRQRWFHDFFNYAGLHRHVWLYATPPAHIDDVTVVTELSAVTGTLSYDVAAEAADGLETHVVLRDADGGEVARNTGSSGVLTVADVHPWRLGEAYLYSLTTELRAASGDLVDTYTLPVGVRTVAVDGQRFLLNGEPVYFRGFGRHEDSAVRGKGHDDALMVHDAELMTWIGANSYRTSHYPYAEEELEYADRHGALVIDETAAVGLNMGLSIFAGAPAETYSVATINDETRETHAQALRELVARDKNHPCVVLWSVANEPESHTPQARDYFEPLFDLVRELDPTRPAGFTNMGLAPAGSCQVSDLADVLMINRYYGWYELAGDLAGAERKLEAELRQWAELYDKPIIVTEYGADAVAGIHALTDVTWSEEYQARMLETFHRVFDRIDAVVGEHVWAFADFATGPGHVRVDGNKKGVFTRDRRPKAAAFAIRRRWTNG